jgi:hypothetical protein
MGEWRSCLIGICGERSGREWVFGRRAMGAGKGTRGRHDAEKIRKGGNGSSIPETEAVAVGCASGWGAAKGSKAAVLASPRRAAYSSSRGTRKRWPPVAGCQSPADRSVSAFSPRRPPACSERSELHPPASRLGVRLALRLAPQKTPKEFLEEGGVGGQGAEGGEGFVGDAGSRRLGRLHPWRAT